MDHRVSKDMISQGMSVKGEKTTEDLNNTQMGKVATPHNMLDAYRSMYEKKEDINETRLKGSQKGVTLKPRYGDHLGDMYYKDPDEGELESTLKDSSKKRRADTIKPLKQKVKATAKKMKKVEEDFGIISIPAALAAATTAAKAGGAALAAKGAAAAGAAKAGAATLAAKGAGAVKAVKATGLAAKATKVGKFANKASTVSNVASLGMRPSSPSGGNGSDSGSRTGTLAAGNELDGDVIQELIDSGKFSEEELKSLTEISADLALKASGEADKKRGKLAAAGDKEGAKAKASQASRLYAASGEKRKKEPVAIPDRSFPKGKGKDYKEG